MTNKINFLKLIFKGNFIISFKKEEIMKGVFKQTVMLLLMISFTYSQVTFNDMADELNIDDLDFNCGAGIIDINNDGFSEIILTSHIGCDRLYMWYDSIYYEVGGYYGIHDADYHHCIAITDVDKNYLPDIFITGDPAHGNHGHLYINHGYPPFTDEAEEYNLSNVIEMSSSFFQFTPCSELAVLCGGRLMVREGRTFIDITEGSGLENLSNVQMVLFFDIDGDKDDDIFIAHNWELNVGTLFRNNGDGTFTDISTNTNEGGFGYGQGVTYGDIDNDGDFDLYLCSGYGTNAMWENDGTGYFRNITYQSNTDYVGYTRGAVFGDFDNDCDLDIFLNRADDYNMLLLNNGHGVFDDYSAEAGVMDNYNGFGCSTGDLNNDGQLDIVAVNCCFQPKQVYINQNQNTSFLKIKLIGQYPNTLALGAIVDLYGITDELTDTIFIGKRQVVSHSSMYSVNDPIVHLGTGEYNQLRVVVTFNSLVVVDTSGISPGQFITIIESAEVSIDEPTPQIPSEHIVINAYPNPFNKSIVIDIKNLDSYNYELTIHDLLGRQIKKEYINNEKSTSYIWDGTDDHGKPIPSGIYFLRVRSEHKKADKKIILLK